MPRPLELGPQERHDAEREASRSRNDDIPPAGPVRIAGALSAAALLGLTGFLAANCRDQRDGRTTTQKVTPSSEESEHQSSTRYRSD